MTDTEIKHREWVETIKVVDRGVRSRLFVGAGHMLRVLPGGPGAVSVEPGTFQTIRGPLTPGLELPGDRVRAAPDRPPAAHRRDALSGLHRRLPRHAPAGGQLAHRRARRCASRRTARATRPTPRSPTASSAGAARRRSSTPRTTGCTPSPSRSRRRPGRRSRTPRRVLQRVQNGETYSERPPPARVPLMDFLFGNRLGYCQQFSGVMALMLRMGGVPARVASGFSPGRFDTQAQRVRRARRRRPLLGRGVLPGDRVGRRTTRRRPPRPRARRSPTSGRATTSPRRRGRTSASARPVTGRSSRATRARGSRSGRSATGSCSPCSRSSSRCWSRAWSW